MRLLQKLSLKSLVAVFSLALLIPSLVAIWIFYQNASDTTTALSLDYSQQMIDRVSKDIDSYISDKKRQLLPLLTQEKTLIFLACDADTLTYDRFVRYVDLHKVLTQSTMAHWPDISVLSVVSSDGFACSTGSFLPARESARLYYPVLRDQPGHFMPMEVRRVADTPVITFAQAFQFSRTSPYPPPPPSILIVDFNLREFARHIPDGQDNTGFVWLVSQDGQILYHPDSARVGTFIEPDAFAATSAHYTTEKRDGEWIMICKQTHPEYGWTYVSEMTISSASNEVVRLQQLMIFLLLPCLLLAFFSSTIFKYLLTRPLYQLLRVMKNVEQGGLSAEVPQGWKHEYGKLFGGLRSMLTEIQHLMTQNELAKIREKEMELMLKQATLNFMQATINPHFLYNTLELINAHSIVERCPNVGRMTRSLAKFFRYSISSVGKDVSLYEELEHTLTYLEIQKERHQALEIHVDLDPDVCKRVGAVRLMLQPIVENAFRHGYDAHLLSPTFIGITGVSAPQAFEVYIEDNGHGMTPEQMTQYNDSFAKDIESDLLPNTVWFNSAKHIGMWNVHYRLWLMFHNGYDLHIVRSSREGTIIRIRLPWLP